MSRIYREDLDLLKGISIIVVILYHIGILATGYLGVDAFFVINGFLVIPPLISQIDNDNQFSYLNYVKKRIMRLWPLCLLAAFVSLLIGICGMLPDDLENLSHSAIATTALSQNILSAITTGNYWDVVNEYKPLMHFWYIGILVEFYILFPLIMLILKWISRRTKVAYKVLSTTVICILLISSFLLYINPEIVATSKFYYLPFRLFEILAGGLVGILISLLGTPKVKLSSIVGGVSILFLTAIMVGSIYLPSELQRISPVSGQVSELYYIPQSVLLVLVVVLTCILLIFKVDLPKNPISKVIVNIGKMSFSIFVWHQLLLAFYRYFISERFNISIIILIILLTLGLSLLSYNYIENKIKNTWASFRVCVLGAIIIIIPSLYIHFNAGVIRDVPELQLKFGEGRSGIFAEYCDRIYDYDRDFSSDDKIKVLVEGISFGRDFANVLLESVMADKIELSYIFVHDEKFKDRYSNCDYLFTFKDKQDVPNYVWDYLKSSSTVIGLGPKNFGVCNGVIYQKRHNDDYYLTTTTIHPNFYMLNENWKTSWGEDNYIDFIDLSTAKDGNITVFYQGEFISQDCRHLTEAGAKFFANHIDWNTIFNIYKTWN